jgi:phage replication O-like protein O
VDDTYHFRGFRKPTYTQVPDEVFDELMPILSGSEFKVLMYVIRRTFGFQKGSDRISKAQMEFGIRRKDGSILDGGTGLSRRAIRLAVESLVEKDILIKITHQSPERGDETTEYALNIIGVDPWVESTQGEGQKVPTPVGSAYPHNKQVNNKQ